MTKLYVESAAEALVELRRQRPLVHNITITS